MPVRRFAPITVVGRPVRTFIEVRRGDLVNISATGTVDFGGAFLGLGAPVLGPDGDNWITPSDYPAPELHKNSLIVGVRSASGPILQFWFQGGANRSFTSPMDGLLTLAANDGLPDDNTRGWSVSITVTTPERFGNSNVRVGIDRVEFVQSLQRTDNSVPLVAGKQTLIRVFVNSGRSNIDPVPVTGTIQVATPDGRILMLTPSVDGSAIPEGNHIRNNIASSLNFILPSSITGTATFRIHVFVRGRQTDAGYFTESTVTATFVAAPVITIRPFLIGFSGPGIAPPSLAAATATLTEAIQRLPISSNSPILPFSSHTYLLPWSGDPTEWRNLLYTVGDVLSEPGVGRIGSPGERNFIQVAFITRVPTSAMGGIALPAGWLIVPSAVTEIGGDPDFNADSCAHEIGHTLGLQHAECGGPPIPLDSHLPRFTEEPGWFAARNRMVPQNTPEMMSYCNPRWPSITGYEFILNGRFI